MLRESKKCEKAEKEEKNKLKKVREKLLFSDLYKPELLVFGFNTKDLDLVITLNLIISNFCKSRGLQGEIRQFTIPYNLADYSSLLAEYVIALKVSDLQVLSS